MPDRPTFDADGYPTDETLKRIREWPCDTLADMEAAMDFAGKAWAYQEAWTKERGWVDPEWPSAPPEIRYCFSTFGWSGNESVVGAIKANQMLQAIGAYSWRRGGHYEYRFPMPWEADHA